MKTLKSGKNQDTNNNNNKQLDQNKTVKVRKVGINNSYGE